MKKIVNVIAQTHWDREWYFTNQTFVVRLFSVMKQIVKELDNEELLYFLFDGQVSALDDLITHGEPELTTKVLKYIKEGRIIIGPWYIMADEFLCHGESLIRNLQLGIKKSNIRGGYQKIGYLPDNFGHISQMPQILKQLEIDNAVIWRGVDQKKSEFIWKASNTDTVFCIFLTEGYYQHPFNTLNWKESLNNYLTKIDNRTDDNQLLLTQGGDHLTICNQLQTKINNFNNSQNKYYLKQNTLASYINSKKKLSNKLVVQQGELRENDQTFVLPDVLSTRTYLKQLNQSAEDRLLGEIEPLLLYSANELNYPTHYIEKTWQLLIEQHAHDSICGCSIDDVHEEMEVRYKQLDQRLNALKNEVSYALKLTSNWLNNNYNINIFADDQKFSLFNSQLSVFEGPITLTISLNDDQDFFIYDEKNQQVKFDIISKNDSKSFISPINDFPEMMNRIEFKILIYTKVSAFSFKKFLIKYSPTGKKTHQTKSDKSNIIQNEYYRVEFKSNSIRIFNKKDQEWHEHAIQLISQLDAGDTYNFSPVNKKSFNAKFISIEDTFIGDSIQTLSINIELLSPKGLNKQRKPSTVLRKSQGKIKFTLLQGVNWIHNEVSWTNRAMDQRLRVYFPQQEKSQYHYADSAFDWIKRSVVYNESINAKGQQEAKVTVNPSQSCVQYGRFSFYHKGLTEYEITKQNDTKDRLGFTLIRSIGWLSRRDLRTRGIGAGPDIPTPDAQCLRSFNFKFGFSLIPITNFQCLNDVKNIRQPLSFLNGHTTASHFLNNAEITDKRIMVSSLKLSNGKMELRVWNPTNESLIFGLNKKTLKFKRINLLGNPILNQQQELLKPKQIATYLITCDL